MQSQYLTFTTREHSVYHLDTSRVSGAFPVVFIWFSYPCSEKRHGQLDIPPKLYPYKAASVPLNSSVLVLSCLISLYFL